MANKGRTKIGEKKNGQLVDISSGEVDTIFSFKEKKPPTNKRKRTETEKRVTRSEKKKKDQPVSKKDNSESKKKRDDSRIPEKDGNREDSDESDDERDVRKTLVSTLIEEYGCIHSLKLQSWMYASEKVYLRHICDNVINILRVNGVAQAEDLSKKLEHASKGKRKPGALIPVYTKTAVESLIVLDTFIAMDISRYPLKKVAQELIRSYRNTIVSSKKENKMIVPVDSKQDDVAPVPETKRGDEKVWDYEPPEPRIEPTVPSVVQLNEDQSLKGNESVLRELFYPDHAQNPRHN